MMEVTLELARRIAQSRPQDVPDEALHHARRSLVNWFGCVLGGCRHEAVGAVLAALGDGGDRGSATVIGRGERVDVLLAALVNAVSGNVLDFDDTHARMVLHPSGPVASALFAFAESRPVSGAALLHAFVLGVEVEARVLDPQVAAYRFAWSPTTTVGALGAAAAIGWLLGLDAQRMAWALGLAATQACGLRETGGSMAKSYNPGHAARCGIVSARLAAAGLTGPERALEGPNGFVAAFGEVRDVDAVVRGWGDSWHVASNTFKAFPCGIVTHAAIDAALQLRARHRLAGEDIDHVALRVHPVALRLTGRRAPTGPLEAKLSVFHCVAAALVHGVVGVRQFALDCIADPRVLRLRDGMTGQADDSLATDAAAVQLTTRAGEVLSVFVEHAVGSEARPMTDADLAAKVRELARDVLPGARCDELLDRLWKLHDEEDAGGLARLTVPRV